MARPNIIRGLATVLVILRSLCRALNRFKGYIYPRLSPADQAKYDALQAACSAFLLIVPEPDSAPEIT